MPGTALTALARAPRRASRHASRRPRATPRLSPLLALLIAASPFAARAQNAQQAPQPATYAAAPSAQAAQLLSAARMWMAKNRPDVAQGLVEKALLFNPQQPDSLALKGEIELRMNHTAEAAKALAQLKKIAPNAPATQELSDAYRVATSDKNELAQIRLLSSAGKSDEAAARMKKLFPNGAPRGDLARDYYRIIAGTDAGRVQVLGELRARLKQNPGDSATALMLGDMLTDRASTRMEGLNLIYRVYQRQDSNRAQALELWRRALGSAGRDDPAYYVWYLRYLQEVPDDTDTQETVADLAKKLGPKGVAQANAAAASGQPYIVASGGSNKGGGGGGGASPRRAGPGAAARNRGLAQLQRGDLKDAEASLQTAQRAAPNDGETLGALGLVRMREGRQDEARDLFARAQAGPRQCRQMAQPRKDGHPLGHHWTRPHGEFPGQAGRRRDARPSGAQARSRQ